ncbi:hypothetical protein GCM10010440_45930 [Kitasatospora cinereorecta]
MRPWASTRIGPRRPTLASDTAVPGPLGTAEAAGEVDAPGAADAAGAPDAPGEAAAPGDAADAGALGEAGAATCAGAAPSGAVLAAVLGAAFAGSSGSGVGVGAAAQPPTATANRTAAATETAADGRSGLTGLSSRGDRAGSCLHYRLPRATRPLQRPPGRRSG